MENKYLSGFLDSLKSNENRYSLKKINKINYLIFSNNNIEHKKNILDNLYKISIGINNYNKLIELMNDYYYKIEWNDYSNEHSQLIIHNFIKHYTESLKLSKEEIKSSTYQFIFISFILYKSLNEMTRLILLFIEVMPKEIVKEFDFNQMIDLNYGDDLIDDEWYIGFEKDLETIKNNYKMKVE